MIGSIRQDGVFLQQVASVNMQHNAESSKKLTKEEKPETTRVQQIKEALLRGEYKIDIGGSAEKMARNLLGRV